MCLQYFFFFSSRRRHTRWTGDWSSDVCSSDLEFGPFFTDRYKTPWGQALNFDGPDSAGVRRHFIENVRSWVRDFHVDGLRLDRSEERRVGKEWRSRGWTDHAKKKGAEVGVCRC